MVKVLRNNLLGKLVWIFDDEFVTLWCPGRETKLVTTPDKGRINTKGSTAQLHLPA
jgi:hypothetical protein